MSIDTVDGVRIKERSALGIFFRPNDLEIQVFRGGKGDKAGQYGLIISLGPDSRFAKLYWEDPQFGSIAAAAERVGKVLNAVLVIIERERDDGNGSLIANALKLHEAQHHKSRPVLNQELIGKIVGLLKEERIVKTFHPSFRQAS